MIQLKPTIEGWNLRETKYIAVQFLPDQVKPGEDARVFEDYGDMNHDYSQPMYRMTEFLGAVSHGGHIHEYARFECKDLGITKDFCRNDFGNKGSGTYMGWIAVDNTCYLQEIC